MESEIEKRRGKPFSKIFCNREINNGRLFIMKVLMKQFLITWLFIAFSVLPHAHIVRAQDCGELLARLKNLEAKVRKLEADLHQQNQNQKTLPSEEDEHQASSSLSSDNTSFNPWSTQTPTTPTTSEYSSNPSPETYQPTASSPEPIPEPIEEYTTTSSSVTYSPSSSSSITDLSKIIRARVFNKKIQNTVSGKRISVLIAFTNTTAKDITAVKGKIVLKDYIGNILTIFFLELNKYITSYDSKSWFGEIPYDPDNEGYKKLEYIQAEEIVVVLEPTEIVFSDGTIKR